MSTFLEFQSQLILLRYQDWKKVYSIYSSLSQGSISIILRTDTCLIECYTHAYMQQAHKTSHVAPFYSSGEKMRNPPTKTVRNLKAEPESF